MTLRSCEQVTHINSPFSLQIRGCDGDYNLWDSFFLRHVTDFSSFDHFWLVYLLIHCSFYTNIPIKQQWCFCELWHLQDEMDHASENAVESYLDLGILRSLITLLELELLRGTLISNAGRRGQRGISPSCSFPRGRKGKKCPVHKFFFNNHLYMK